MFRLRNAIVGWAVLWVGRKLMARVRKRSHSSLERTSQGFNL
jgi:hypothetical protein